MKLLKKLGGEGSTKLLDQEKSPASSLVCGKHMIYALNNAFAQVFYCSFVLLSQCTNKVIDGCYAIIRSSNVTVLRLLAQAAT